MDLVELMDIPIVTAASDIPYKTSSPANPVGEITAGVSDFLNKTSEPVRESIDYTGHKINSVTFSINSLIKTVFQLPNKTIMDL